MKPIPVTLDGHADWFVFLTASTCMFVDIVLNMYNSCHSLLTLKLHKENDNDFAYYVKTNPGMHGLFGGENSTCVSDTQTS